MLKFSDGVSIDSSGDPRILSLSDGLYVVGMGHIIPVDNINEALLVVERLEGNNE